MTTDQQISADLAMLGKASRERPTPFATTMAALAPKSRVTTANDVAIARVYVARIGRIAGGLTLLTVMAGFFGWLVVSDLHSYDTGNWQVLWHGAKWQVALGVAGTAALVRLIATEIVERRILRSPPREVPPWIERESTWVSIFSTSAAVLLLGWSCIVLGYHSFGSLLELHVGSPSWDTQSTVTDPFAGTAVSFTYVLGAILTAIGVSAIVARFVAAWTRAVPRWLVAVAVIVGFATVLVGLTRDIGPILVTFTQSRSPSIVLRSTLLATGTFSIVTLVSWYVLRRRNHEDAAMSGTIARDEAPRAGDRP